MERTDAKELFALSAIALVGLVLVRPNGPVKMFPIDLLVDPESVSDISAEIESKEGDFALNAWQYVGSSIDYSYYGSFLHFYDHTVKCQSCLLPAQVLSIGRANCVGKAALLTSILRRKYSHTDVYMAIGEYRRNGVGGHAWVNLKRNGVWYLIEATSPPPKTNPWVSAYELSEIYVPDAWLNDQGVICYDEEVCSFEFSVNGCPCGLDKI